MYTNSMLIIPALRETEEEGIQGQTLSQNKKYNNRKTHAHIKEESSPIKPDPLNPLFWCNPQAPAATSLGALTSLPVSYTLSQSCIT